MTTPCGEEEGPRESRIRRLLSPLVAVFRQGTEPAKMAESIAIGTFLGILPLPGLNSILCAVVAVRRRLNMGVIQAVNWLVLPVQIAAFIPLSRIGAGILGHQPIPLLMSEVRELLKSGPTAFFKAVGFGFLDATLAWCLIGIPACCAILYTVKHILLARKKTP